MRMAKWTLLKEPLPSARPTRGAFLIAEYFVTRTADMTGSWEGIRHWEISPQFYGGFGDVCFQRLQGPYYFELLPRAQQVPYSKFVYCLFPLYLGLFFRDTSPSRIEFFSPLVTMDNSPPPPSNESPPPQPPPPQATHTGSPTDFLKGVVGKRVIVRLTSGVDYRGGRLGLSFGNQCSD